MSDQRLEEAVHRTKNAETLSYVSEHLEASVKNSRSLLKKTYSLRSWVRKTEMDATCKEEMLKLIQDIQLDLVNTTAPILMLGSTFNLTKEILR
jgi:hypothetical protein